MLKYPPGFGWTLWSRSSRVFHGLKQNRTCLFVCFIKRCWTHASFIASGTGEEDAVNQCSHITFRSLAGESCRALRTPGNAPQGRRKRDRREGAGGRLDSLGTHTWTAALLGFPLQRWKEIAQKKSCQKDTGKGELANGPLKRKLQFWPAITMEELYQEGVHVSCIMPFIPASSPGWYN